ncbi:MAG: glycosyltransferase family A protein [Patescibacteria group bacterium]|nr:glycosyltransferase family A protein [Patescibacteria group bacterium]
MQDVDNNSDVNRRGIAVVIPCFNHAKELAACLESLTRQTLQPAEVLVVDNVSEDHPEAIAEGFKDSLPLRIIRFTEKQGAPAARNHGAESTTSARLIFLDADVVLETNALAHLSDALDKNAEAAFAYSNFYWDFKKFPSRPWDIAALHKMNYIHTTALVRRKAFPGFDETLKKFQDWDLWLTMAKNGAKGVFVDEYLFRVKQRSSGISSWLPSFIHKVPWPIFGWMPKEIKKYRDAEKIIRMKHGI